MRKKEFAIPLSRKSSMVVQGWGQLFEGLTPGRASHKFTNVARSIGLTNMKLHSLRHTLATLLIAMGYDIKVVKDLLGHEDIRMTELYAKTGNEILQRAVRSLEILSESGYDLVTRGDKQLPIGNKNA